MKSGHLNHHRRSPAPKLPAPAELAVKPRVVVARSSTELNEWAATRRHHHPHVAVGRPGGGQTVPSIAASVLVGCGKRPDLTVLKHRSEHVAAAWLTHGEATDVVLVEAQLVGGWFMPELITWFCGLGVTPWLIYGTVDDDWTSTVDDVTKSATTVADDWGVEVEDEAALRSTFSDRPIRTRRTAASTAPPVVPRCDGIVFRSTCKDLLSKAEFAMVDREFVAAVRTLRAELNAANASSDRQKRRPVSAALKAALERQGDTERFVVWVRAAQVAGVTEGWQVKVDTAMLCAAAETLPRLGTADTEANWARLNEYRDPDVGAIAALVVSGLSWRDLPDLTVGDASVDDGGTVTVAGTPIVAGGARFLQVLVTYRRLVGAEDSDPLFATHRMEGVRPQFGYKMLTAAATEAGVHVTDLSAGPKVTEPETWLRRHGISIRHLLSQTVRT